jgi:plastocyanin
MRVIRILAVLAVAATFGLATGCGGGDDDEDTVATEATTNEEAAAGGGGATEISMTEYAFDPADVTVSKGDTITVTNDGQLPHNYTVMEGDGSGAKKLPPDLRDLALGTGDVDPGSSGEYEVGDMELGEYKVVCTIPGHAEQGMGGTLTVRKG